MHKVVLILALEIFASRVVAQEPTPIPVITPEAAATPAPSGTPVEIIVRVKGDGKVIKRAEVKIGDEGFYTDAEGKVKLMIPPGEGKVAILRQRYKTLILDFATLREKPTFNAFMFPGDPLDNEVYVRGVKRPSVSRKTISGEESARVAPGGDPVQVTKLMPGVQTQSFSPDIIVRGSGPSDSRYYVDNFQVFDIFHRVGNISIMPDQLISDVEFSSGGFGAQYGEATGGVVVLRTKTEIPESPKTEFRINIPVYSTIYHERPLSDHSMLAVSARYSYLDKVLEYALPKDSGLTVAPYFADAHAVYVNKNDDGGHTKIMSFGTNDGLKLIFNNEEADAASGQSEIDLYSEFVTVGIEKLQPLSSGWSYEIAPQVLYSKTRNTFFGDRLNWDSYSVRLLGELTKKFSSKEYMYIGIEPSYGSFDVDIMAPQQSNDPLFDYEDAPRRTLKQHLEFQNYAAWISVDKQLGSFIFTPGLRGFYNSQIDESDVDPRLNIRWEITDAQALKAAVGQYSKSPQPYEGDSIFGNPDLDYIKSMHYVGGWESRWADRWETDFQLFYKKTHNVVIPDPEKSYVNSGEVVSKGAEAFLRRNLTEKLFGWLSYTYSESRQRDNGYEEFRDGEYDQTHVATFVGSYRLTALWDLGWRMGYHTGDTYTPVDDAVYNANLDKYQPRNDPDNRNSKRLPNFHQIDLFVTKEFLLNTWRLALRGGVESIAFTNQVYGKTNNYDYSDEQNINNIPLIPFIELRGVL